MCDILLTRVSSCYKIEKEKGIHLIDIYCLPHARHCFRTRQTAIHKKMKIKECTCKKDNILTKSKPQKGEKKIQDKIVKYIIYIRQHLNSMKNLHIISDVMWLAWAACCEPVRRTLLLCACHTPSIQA